MCVRVWASGCSTQPWYINAVAKGGPSWLTVNDGVTIITYAEPKYTTDALPTLLGVIAADFVLDKFVHAVVGFLKDVSPNGEVCGLPRACCAGRGLGVTTPPPRGHPGPLSPHHRFSSRMPRACRC